MRLIKETFEKFAPACERKRVVVACALPAILSVPSVSFIFFILQVFDPSVELPLWVCRGHHPDVEKDCGLAHPVG